MSVGLFQASKVYSVDIWAKTGYNFVTKNIKTALQNVKSCLNKTFTEI